MDKIPSPKDSEKCRHRKNRRSFVLFLGLILLFSIPLCLFVFYSPPKVIVFWWAEEYDQDTPSIKEKPDYLNLFQEKNQFSKPQKDEVKDKVEKETPKVLLISYDGFRWDYIQKNNNTPTFRWLIANGIFATEGLKNTFITITAPNHYGIVTGLFEESHGIVANNFFGPEYNETFNYFDDRAKTDPRFFKNGEPIWVTNDRAGAGRATGCQMWVGCDIPIKDHLPKHYVSWDSDLAWITRVDSIITWFKDPVDPINLGLLYIEEPDETGHMYGPDDPRTAAMVQKLDQLTAYLLWRLYSEDLLDKVNMIFTADHGMGAVPWANVVNLDQYVNKSLYTVYGGTPNWNVLPVPGAEKEVYDALYNKVPHLSVYNKTTIPLDYHYTNTPHVLPLQFVADLHWRLAHNDTVSAANDNNGGTKYERKTRGRMLTRMMEISNSTVGEHGYNNSLTDMHPYFIAHGPAFKKGYNISQFWNLDIYPLMAHILGVDPAPNNGSFDRVKSILQNNGEKPRAKLFQKNRPSSMKFDQIPPWALDFAATTASTPREYHIKVAQHYFPLAYSVNFDIFIMTLLLFLYVAIVIALSKRVRRNRHHKEHEQLPIQAEPPTLVNKEKCQIIDIVA